MSYFTKLSPRPSQQQSATPKQQRFLERLKQQQNGQKIKPIMEVTYDSVQPVQEIVFDPTKSINLLIDNPDNGDL